MAKYIDRDALIEWLKRIRLIDLSDGLGVCRVIMEDDFKKAITNMPENIIVDVAPVRHGRWEEYLIPNILCCSNCDWGIGPLCKSPYCPNCGAKMDENWKQTT